MRKAFVSTLIIFTTATSTSVAQTAEKPNGSGTESDPYAIATLNNLYWLIDHSHIVDGTSQFDHWDKHYR